MNYDMQCFPMTLMLLLNVVDGDAVKDGLWVLV